MARRIPRFCRFHHDSKRLGYRSNAHQRAGQIIEGRNNDLSKIAHMAECILPYLLASLDFISGLSCKTTFNRELWISSFPLYSIKPSLRNLFMKKLTRDRVVPIISANVSWLNFPTIGTGTPSLPKLARRRSSRARRFSLELNSWSIRSSSIRLFRDSRYVMNNSENSGSL